MDAPRCIVCNTKHWSRQPCPSQKEARLEHARDVLRQAEAIPVRQEPVRQSELAVRQPVRQAAREKSNNEPPVKQPTDRKAYLRDYMREYMRQRRAEAKAPQTVAASS
jgi:hypothetical protein